MSWFEQDNKKIKISRTQKLSDIPQLLQQAKLPVNQAQSVFLQYLQHESKIYTSYMNKINIPPPALKKIQQTQVQATPSNDKNMIIDKLRELLGHDIEVQNALKNETQARKAEVHLIIEKADEISESSEQDSIFASESEITSIGDFDDLSLCNYDDYLDYQEEEYVECTLDVCKITPNHDKADFVVNVIAKLIDAGRVNAFKKLFVIGVDEYDKW
ncbi:hypothetical protein SS50377_25309 [Spironucleus salmonicida]|uniref:Uncharacterized protein n=1 Tax=Spironucleus salmonicida TaxID=348837 RepID=V6LBH5_9EUKA|nr:hypothetical protein SS50377_25309 [Spironucleus salmonicida]|eukprot:EST41810.1 Hypothetical protein SS50377_18644 [Spironucleus salmonicida]